MKTLPLTEKQERLWRFIMSCERSPTFNEMAAALGMKFKSESLSVMIRNLEERGFVRRMVGRARSIVALDPRSDLDCFSTSDLAAEVARRLAA